MPEDTVSQSAELQQEVGRFRRACRRTGQMMLWTTVVIFFVWAVGAVWYFRYLPKAVSILLATAYAVTMVTALVRIPDRRRWRRIAALSVAGIYLVSLVQRPSNDRNWAEDNRRQPDIVIDGDSVTVDGFRHSVYRSETDFDVHYRRMQFQLSQLDKVWFVVQRFTPLEGIAHNFLTFRLQTDSGPQYFSVSIEIRREVGESFSPVKGLYRQYELIYVIADERDEIGARTVMRPQDRVYMFPVNASAQKVQELFREITRRIQKLQTSPEFYHSLLNNCTNNIVRHTRALTDDSHTWLDPRIVAPGFADRYAWSKKLIGRAGQTFNRLQQECRIDIIARKAGITDSFSTDIRPAESVKTGLNR